MVGPRSREPVVGVRPVLLYGCGKLGKLTKQPIFVLRTAEPGESVHDRRQLLIQARGSWSDVLGLGQGQQRQETVCFEIQQPLQRAPGLEIAETAVVNQEPSKAIAVESKAGPDDRLVIDNVAADKGLTLEPGRENRPESIRR